MRAGRRAGKRAQRSDPKLHRSPRAKSEVDRITDYLLLNLRGLSAYARLGYTQKKLNDCARTAGPPLKESLLVGHLERDRTLDPLIISVLRELQGLTTR